MKTLEQRRCHWIVRSSTGDVNLWPTVDCKHTQKDLVAWMKANPDKWNFLRQRFGEKTAALR